MALIDILGYVGALIIGLVLGLTGGGGSILTVPVLVYVLGYNPVIATGYSLFIVGASSSFGALRNIQKGLINYKTSLIFAIPAVIAVFSTRRFLVPAIPEVVFSLGDFEVTKDILIMVFFAVLMLLASISMIKEQKDTVIAQNGERHIKYGSLIVLGAATGLITGTVGAGGGFIIVPILVLLAKLPMKEAVGTSLFIIAINSLLGFLGDLSHIDVDWIFLLSFTFIAIIGIFIGIYLNKFIDGKKLKKSFGWFVLIMGIYIIYKEITQ
ncbi:sulfite exporter TauE/SafE family protein [Gillisia sp. M10.2A]|uniref:Probable membrane transporter protein n=1 Tax=Gillisia lutea TaxID=2909668 RepID=A0ABS9EF00_9FLAO|nr:sulfite exporter TauE/SafE family protein [Gillisia lutea]MCF4101426.1 sulfite exporter TauE/SafE family protein [Gillisia lutea]